MSDDQETEWKFSWNAWIGVMYGPIPVGLILLGIAGVVYFATQ